MSPRFPALGLGAILALAAAAAPPLPAGRSDRTLVVGGRTRSYVLHVPGTPAPAGGWPVVLAFHGGAAGAEAQEVLSGLHRLGDEKGFVTVYPRGSGKRARTGLTWNGGFCCAYAFFHQVDDVGFVAALLDELALLLPVRHGMVFATGISNGALLCYKLAEALPDRFAAIAPVAAPMGPRAQVPARPVPVIHFHGTADKIAPFGGGVGERGLGKVWFPPVREAVLRLLPAYGCPPEPKREALPDREDDGTTVVRETWGPGKDGAEIVFYTIEGGGHSWPGGPPLAKRLLGTTTREIDANRLMWDFFVEHARRD